MKIFVLLFFLLFDLALNCTLDFEEFNETLAKNFLLGLFGLQVVVEISIFLILFLAAADTFLFRVGLLGILFRTIHSVLILHPAYVLLTVATGSYRIGKLSSNYSMTELWDDHTFIALSFFQKLSS
jgi:hypothetical protein